MVCTGAFKDAVCTVDTGLVFELGIPVIKTCYLRDTMKMVIVKTLNSQCSKELRAKVTNVNDLSATKEKVFTLESFLYQ